MSLKTYTITTEGLSDGNVIAQPFTIEVHKINYTAEQTIDGDVIPGSVAIVTCTKNSGDIACINDDIAGAKQYDLPAMDTTKDADLIATLEVDLTAAYGANWSKD